MSFDRTSRRGGSFLRASSGFLHSFWFAVSSLLIILYIAVPLGKTLTAPTLERLLETLHDPEVIASVWLSMSTAATAGLLALVFGTPLGYLLARSHFPGKRIVESLIDLPIMIPHPVIGISILTVTSPNTYLGSVLESLGIEIMGTRTGIVSVLFFVGLPFYISAVKTGIESIPVRLEKVSRSLGANKAQTFLRVTLPLSWRHMLVGIIMCMARALSEFGAVIIVAYHPMIAPVLMYERFTAYGLTWSQPVAVILILVSLLFFIGMRAIPLPDRDQI